MRIAAVTLSYPNLSEQFVVREFEGLAARGHDVRVFTRRPPDSPLTVATTLEVCEWTDANLRAFAPDVLYASLGFPAHQRTVDAARLLHVPYALRCWQGYDMFCNPSPDFYAAAVADPRCLAVVVEDDFARRYAAVEMRADGPKVRVVPNGIDTDIFAPRTDRSMGGPVRVLAIARWVRKKGLAHLCAAWRSIRPTHAELVIVGYGPEEERLRAAAGLRAAVTFRPPILPDQLAAEYRAADVFAAPCVAIKGGDADGVPTTVLEAMACGVPILASDLHSMPLYVEHGASGLLTPPGDERALADALVRLLDDAELRRRMGEHARRVAVGRFSLVAALDALGTILASGDKHARWRAGVEAMHARRATYTPERLAYYDRIADECLAFLDPRGHVLDVGCGDASMRDKLGARGCASYLGVDPGSPSSQWVRRAAAEALPFAAPQFDTVLMYSVLQHVADPATALAEAHRVLRDGGRLCAQVCVSDPNPIFMHWWKPAEVLRLIEGARFVVESSKVLEGRLLCVRARKPHG